MVQARTYGRRGFLATVGASAVTLGPSLFQSPARAAGGSHAGKLVFVYDDSPVEDYTKTFPVHQEADAPACIAAVSGAIGTEGALSADTLREIESAGWEIMSHTVEHRALGTLPVTADVEPGDTRVYAGSNRHGAHPGDRVRVFDGDAHAVSTVAGQGSDETGEYVALEGSVGTAFDADTAKIRYTDGRIRESLRRSRRQLEGYGTTVSNLVLPYGINGERARELVPTYYDAVANAKWDGDGLNETGSLNPYRLHRVYFRPGQMTLEELEAYLDAVAERDVLGLLGGHSAYEQFTAERVRTAIRMARERDVEILTLREALADLGVVDSTATQRQPTETTAQPTATAHGTLSSPTTAGETPPSPTTAGETTAGETDVPSGGAAATAPPTGTAPASTRAAGPGFGAVSAVSAVCLLAWNRLRESATREPADRESTARD